MIRLVTRGRFTHDYLKGLLAAPEDREAAVRKLIEAAGGKVISFYVTTGETDFLLISEANEAEAIIASLMAAAAAGNVPLVEALLERGADQQNVDHFGHNALHWAMREAFRDPAFASGPFGTLYHLLVRRFSQIDGYRCLSLIRALAVVNCQSALA